MKAWHRSIGIAVLFLAVSGGALRAQQPDIAAMNDDGTLSTELDRVLGLVTANPLPDLSKADRAAMGAFAHLILSANYALADNLGKKSVAAIASKVDLDGQLPPSLLSYIPYLGDVPGYFTHLMTEHSYGLLLLQHSNRRGDWIIAQQFRIRHLLLNGQTNRAIDAMGKLLADAGDAGFSDAELHSVLMDLWAAAKLADVDAIAETAFDRTAPCRAVACPQDLILSFFASGEELEIHIIPISNSMRKSATEVYLRATFPGDLRVLADFYATGAGDQSAPMDAARDAEVSIRYAEEASNIGAADLVNRAARSMDALIYAGLYQAALSIGERIEARIIAGGDTAPLDQQRFWKIRARAAFRTGSDRARDYYAKAVSLGRDSDLALDLLDTPYLDLLEQLRPHTAIQARIYHRRNRSDLAADQLAAWRRYLIIAGESGDAPDKFVNLYASELAAEAAALPKEDTVRRAELEAMIAAAMRRETVPADADVFYRESEMMLGIAWQEAYYREAAEDVDGAAALRSLGDFDTGLFDWAPLPETPDPSSVEKLPGGWRDSYDLIRHIIEFRDLGNYQGAARMMRRYRWVAEAAEANGEYVDAQTLWQMAFTFVRAGETNIAFDLMDRAARIAATLSFKGAGGADGGTLQLLERDRWRYLLFVDIAWAAVSGKEPEDMLVVSRY